MTVTGSLVSRFTTRRRIEFSDTDLSGLVHFSRFFVFMETAEHEFVESLGTRIHVTSDDGEEVGWPRVSAECRYLSPARFGDTLDILVRVERKGERSMTYGFEFTIGERLIARGRIKTVCCVVNDPGGLRSVPVPAAIADCVEADPGEREEVANDG